MPRDGYAHKDEPPQTPWQAQRDEWIKARSDGEILQLAEQIARDASTDENEGDRTETAEAFVWLHSRGKRGREWGIVGRAADHLGIAP